MKQSIFALMVMFVLAMPLAGCSTKTESAVGGALGGAAVGGGTYEYRINEEMKRLDSDYKAGKIDTKEYDARVDELHRMSLIQKS